MAFSAARTLSKTPSFDRLQRHRDHARAYYPNYHPEALAHILVAELGSLLFEEDLADILVARDLRQRAQAEDDLRRLSGAGRSIMDILRDWFQR